MALIRCEFFSDVLGLSTSMHVILPQRTSAQIGMTGAGGNGHCPTLYLLHGLSDDDSSWRGGRVWLSAAGRELIRLIRGRGLSR